MIHLLSSCGTAENNDQPAPRQEKTGAASACGQRVRKAGALSSPPETLHAENDGGNQQEIERRADEERRADIEPRGDHATAQRGEHPADTARAAGPAEHSATLVRRRDLAQPDLEHRIESAGAKHAAEARGEQQREIILFQ